ncbi:oxidoreductase [bacterium]|nr:oxidoreductase [bacterium]
MTNSVFAWAFNAPTNSESVYITALILVLIISPIASPHDTLFFSLAVWASVWAMASKYIFAIGKKHMFNPAALAVAITALALEQSASWWVGTSIMAPFVLIGGILLVRKLIRADLVVSFFVVAAIATVAGHVYNPGVILPNIWRLFVDTPIMFFAFVMLTEPLTTPPRRWTRMLYGALVGAMFFPSAHIGSVYITPELALVIGNVFSYLVSPKQKLLLSLKNRIKLSPDTYHFVFASDRPMSFVPGQYLEWTLDRGDADSRGNRRYFTIASSPTEDGVAMGVKFYPEPSSFKKHLLEMGKDDVLVASQLAGDFVMPRDKQKKLVFVAGGIGITPFRSMIQYLVDTGEQRDIVLLYSNKKTEDIVYRDVLENARQKIGMKVVYVITDRESRGYTGPITSQVIVSEIPDYAERYFYISGPHGMVVGFEGMLQSVGVKGSHIRTDFFPGFA